MANEDDKTVAAGDGKTEDGGSENQPAKGAPPRKLLLFGGFGAGAIVLGVVLAVFVIKPMTSSSGDGGQETATAQGEPSQHDSKSEHADNKHEKPKKKEHSGHGEESANVFAIKDIIVNPAGTGGTRFLSVSFAFELESAELAAEFESRKAVIRDALITILASKTVAQLTDPRQKEIVRYQIKKRLCDLMKTKDLAGVYYTDFVLQ